MKRILVVLGASVLLALSTACGDALAPVTPSATATPGLQAGDTVVLQGGTSGVLAAATSDGVDELRKTVTANDSIGLAAMVVDGRAVQLPNGTHALLIEQTGILNRKANVRLLEGKYVAHAVWIDAGSMARETPAG